jgi:hypothetical protein
MAYDAASQSIVLFGGQSQVTNAYLADTWTQHQAKFPLRKVPPLTNGRGRLPSIPDYRRVSSRIQEDFRFTE